MNNDLTPNEVRRELGLAASTFWRIVYKDNIPHQNYGPRCIRFPHGTVELIRSKHAIRGPKDLRRAADGRRS